MPAAGNEPGGAGVAILKRILGGAGAALVFAGVLLGFRSVSAAGVNCGSAFQPAAGITPMACDNTLNSSGTLVTIVICAGAVCLVASLTLKVVRDRTVRDQVNA
jgi:hypothetical protein